MEITEYKNYNETEILSLYDSVGWTIYTDDPDTIKKGFSNSLLVLAAYEDGMLAGLARIVGDGYTIIYIQDLLVRPEYQRKGIGTALVKSVLERYKTVRQIALSTENCDKNIAFYESTGLVKMSDLGCCGFMKE